MQRAIHRSPESSLTLWRRNILPPHRRSRLHRTTIRNSHSSARAPISSPLLQLRRHRQRSQLLSHAILPRLPHPRHKRLLHRLATIATDSSRETAAYTPICSLPTYQLYQTFTTSKPGTLSEVGVNIAGDNPTGNLTITIFRYQNNSNFFTPHYVWETLTTANIVPSTISQAFEVVRVPVGKAVAAGDNLGITLVSASATPMCMLVQTSANVLFDVGTSTRTLFANGAGQVSLKGPDGTRPPVVVLPGQEIKWYSIVV